MNQINEEQFYPVIHEYRNNNEKLFHDWYKEFQVCCRDYETIPFAHVTLDEIKQCFEKWFNQKQKQLKKIICKEWEYNSKKELFSNKLDALIMLLAVECLTKFLSITIANAIATATILVLYNYLEKLCNESCGE